MTTPPKGRMERLGITLYRFLSLLLPASLRERWAEEMRDDFARRQAEWTSRRTAFALPLLWLREYGSLVGTALRARLPDTWAHRTVFDGHPDPAPGPSPTWMSAYMDHFFQDLQFAFRAFRRRRASNLLAGGSLALGIGASVAMFSVVDGVLLRPLPYPEPESLVEIYVTNPQYAGHPTFDVFADRGTLSMPEFWWIEENQEVFEKVGAFLGYGSATLTGRTGPPEEVQTVIATPDLLDVLAVEPVRGRTFNERDHPDRDARSIMIFESFWESRWGADPAVVGSTIVLDDEPWTVIGVLPATAQVLTTEADGWRLVGGSSAEGNWENHNLTGVVGRLADGVSPERAEAELDRLMAQVPADSHRDHGASVFSAHAELTRNVRPALLTLIAGALVLLAVGCGNVAAILVGAGLDREQEIAVRSTLGATRGRLGRQLLTEGLALTALGGIGGIVLAWLINHGLLYLAPPGVPRIETAALDGRALAFALAVSLAAALLSGLVPALNLSKANHAATVKSSRGTTRGRGRLQGGVVVVELAMATVLLVSGALLGRSLFALNTVDPGFEPDGLYAMRVAPPWQRFEEEGDARTAVLDAYFQEIVEALRAVPGVTSVAVTNNVPLTGDRGNNEVVPKGRDPETEESLVAERRVVSANYFETAGIEIVDGRGFDDGDNRADAAPSVVISEGLAERVWPGESAIGKQLAYWSPDPGTVIGVARNLRDEDLEEETVYAFYVPARQVGPQLGSLLVRSRLESDGLIASLREAVWSVDPDIAVRSVSSLDEIMATYLSGHRYRTRLMIAFAVLAAIFAMMGVYGVVSRSVTRRKREMGIRMALGARRGSVRSLVVRQGVGLAVFGALLGALGAVATTRFLEELLYGVERMDPPTLAGIAVLVGVMSVAASLPPSYRATRVDPSSALREE